MERVSRFTNMKMVPEAAEEMFSKIHEFEELLMIYNCALKEVKTKLEVLNDELSVRYNRNPIEFIKTRLKQPISIAKKLEKNGCELSLESISANLNDVAGVRVVCYFIDDIYDVAGWLSNQDDIKLLQVKDYIKNPKENGYRSLHMIIDVPVFFSEDKLRVPVEVQIRTIAMDFWASLDHQLRYKKDQEGLKDSEILGEELKGCADVIAETDIRMQKIRERIGVFTELT